MPLFETVADFYDAGRPSYPPGVFDALGPLAGLAVLDVGERVTVFWVRHPTISEFLTEVASFSDVAALPADARRSLLAELRSVVSSRFDDVMEVPYETWLWIATPALLV